MADLKISSPRVNRIKIFRWFFYINLTQLLLYYIVPAIIFPAMVVKDIEIISALTLGIVVGMFFLLVNMIGLFVDKARRVMYIIMASIIIIYFSWALISWAYIEHMDYLLR